MWVVAQSETGSFESFQRVSERCKIFQCLQVRQCILDQFDLGCAPTLLLLVMMSLGGRLDGDVIIRLLAVLQVVQKSCRYNHSEIKCWAAVGSHSISSSPSTFQQGCIHTRAVV